LTFRETLAQELIRAAQSVTDRADHLNRDIRVATLL
jgi:hypothetical protein